MIARDKGGVHRLHPLCCISFALQPGLPTRFPSIKGGRVGELIPRGGVRGQRPECICEIRLIVRHHAKQISDQWLVFWGGVGQPDFLTERL